MFSHAEAGYRLSRRISRSRQTYEIILSTYNDDGSPNAAPMGIRFTARKTICARLLRGSRTLRNILARRSAVANLTSDACLFYRTTFKRRGGLPTRYFSRSRLVNAPVLKSAEGYIEMELTRDEQDRESVLAEFKVRRVCWRHVTPAPYSRGAHALIEATVHATRIQKFLPDRKKKREVASLIQLVNHYKDVIERVSPDSDYARAIKELQSRIHRWKRSSQGIG